MEELVARAREARSRAYAPYSGYAVGAALRDSEGRVFGGCNVENALFGATVCAERVALWTAVAAGARRIVALAVVTPDAGSPCGFCRQVLAEFAAPGLPIALAAPEGSHALVTLDALLPLPWGRGRSASQSS